MRKNVIIVLTISFLLMVSACTTTHYVRVRKPLKLGKGKNVLIVKGSKKVLLMNSEVKGDSLYGTVEFLNRPEKKKALQSEEILTSRTASPFKLHPIKKTKIFLL
ncbi:MAG: hypothetical protein K8S56_08390, partial [Candidatus Cloacimonetes bacterium]|nr:hypothetical protein [Candidatus Cloacimonadota bacterium]